MHDPMTVAFEIRSPIKRRTQLFPDGYRNSLVTIWHVDPETDGTDNSCGWTFPKLTKEQRRRITDLAHIEAREPWFQRAAMKSMDDPVQAETLMRGAIVHVARVLDLKVSFAQASEWACLWTHSPTNFRGSLCHLPGWHSNSENDTPHWREDTASGLFASIARNILREQRPWWRHPRWHVHHWRFQVHPWQQFKRWLLERCDECGKRFGPGGVFQIGHRLDSKTGRHVPARKCACCAGVGVPAQHPVEG